MTRTYDALTYSHARKAWAQGDFRDPRWYDVYRLAAEQGYIYPPSGTVHDDRDDPHPSQRAIVYAALCDQPQELRRIMQRSHSWGEVVARLIVHVDGLREAVPEDEVPRREVPERLGEIMKRVAS